MSDWKIGRKRLRCAQCEHEFTEGQGVFSTLVVDDAGIARRDACQGCWEEPRTQVDAAQAYAGESAESAAASDDAPAHEVPASATPPSIWWRSRFREGKKGVALDLESVEALFLALEGRAQVELLELRYLLGLMLMRKRRLKLDKILRGEDGERFLLRRPRRKEELVLAVFDLSPERIAELRAVIQRLFEGAEVDELLAAAAAPAPGVEPREAPAASE